MLKVLIAEEEPMIADVLEYALVEALALFQLHKPDLGVLDVGPAKRGRGPDIVRRIGGKDKVAILHATGDDARINARMAADGEGAIVKPDESANVVCALKIAWEVVTGATISAPIRLAGSGLMFNCTLDATD